MIVEIKITGHTIDTRAVVPEALRARAGALVEFTGVVRAEESGTEIAALEYEAYGPMAERVMRSLLDEIGHEHPCAYVRVVHRVGIVPVGEAAIHVLAAAKHRAAAFELTERFMDRLKQDVPIWKVRALNSAEYHVAKSK